LRIHGSERTTYGPGSRLRAAGGRTLTDVAFNRDLLNTNEELVLDLRPHWAQLIPSGAALAGSVVLALLGIVAWGPDGSLGSGVSILLGLLVLACLVWFGWTYLQWTNTNFVLTTDRIITR